MLATWSTNKDIWWMHLTVPSATINKRRAKLLANKPDRFIPGGSCFGLPKKTHNNPPLCPIDITKLNSRTSCIPQAIHVYMAATVLPTSCSHHIFSVITINKKPQTPCSCL